MAQWEEPLRSNQCTQRVISRLFFTLLNEKLHSMSPEELTTSDYMSSIATPPSSPALHTPTPSFPAAPVFVAPAAADPVGEPVPLAVPLGLAV